MTDPIADMLTRIRNAHAADKKTVVVPFSKMKEKIAHILEEEGYIIGSEIVTQGKFKEILLTLKYIRNTPAIHSLRRVSKPGCRMYARTKTLPVVRNNYGIAIISTSQGVMSNRKAHQLGIGGEVVCEVN